MPPPRAPLAAHPCQRGSPMSRACGVSPFAQRQSRVFPRQGRPDFALGRPDRLPGCKRRRWFTASALTRELT